MVEPELAKVWKTSRKKERATAFSNPKFLNEAQALPSPNRRQLASEVFENMRRKGEGLRGKETILSQSFMYPNGCGSFDVPNEHCYLIWRQTRQWGCYGRPRDPHPRLIWEEEAVVSFLPGYKSFQVKSHAGFAASRSFNSHCYNRASQSLNEVGGSSVTCPVFQRTRLRPQGIQLPKSLIKMDFFPGFPELLKSSWNCILYFFYMSIIKL